MQFITSSIEDSTERMQKDIGKLQEKKVETAREMISELKQEFQIEQPVSQPKIATLSYTKPKESTISLQDKDCNDAILKAMSDKSKEAKASKKEFCAHNIK